MSNNSKSKTSSFPVNQVIGTSKTARPPYQPYGLTSKNQQHNSRHQQYQEQQRYGKTSRSRSSQHINDQQQQDKVSDDVASCHWMNTMLMWCYVNTSTTFFNSFNCWLQALNDQMRSMLYESLSVTVEKIMLTSTPPKLLSWSCRPDPINVNELIITTKFSTSNLDLLVKLCEDASPYKPHLCNVCIADIIATIQIVVQMDSDKNVILYFRVLKDLSNPLQMSMEITPADITEDSSLFMEYSEIKKLISKAAVRCVTKLQLPNFMSFIPGKYNVQEKKEDYYQISSFSPPVIVPSVTSSRNKQNAVPIKNKVDSSDKAHISSEDSVHQKASSSFPRSRRPPELSIPKRISTSTYYQSNDNLENPIVQDKQKSLMTEPPSTKFEMENGTATLLQMASEKLAYHVIQERHRQSVDYCSPDCPNIHSQVRKSDSAFSKDSSTLTAKDDNTDCTMQDITNSCHLADSDKCVHTHITPLFPLKAEEVEIKKFSNAYIDEASSNVSKRSTAKSNLQLVPGVLYTVLVKIVKACGLGGGQCTAAKCSMVVNVPYQMFVTQLVSCNNSNPFWDETFHMKISSESSIITLKAEGELKNITSHVLELMYLGEGQVSVANILHYGSIRQIVALASGQDNELQSREITGSVTAQFSLQKSDNQEFPDIVSDKTSRTYSPNNITNPQSSGTAKFTPRFDYDTSENSRKHGRSISLITPNNIRQESVQNDIINNDSSDVAIGNNMGVTDNASGVPETANMYLQVHYGKRGQLTRLVKTSVSSLATTTTTAPHTTESFDMSHSSSEPKDTTDFSSPHYVEDAFVDNNEGNNQEQTSSTLLDNEDYYTSNGSVEPIYYKDNPALIRRSKVPKFFATASTSASSSPVLFNAQNRRFKNEMDMTLFDSEVELSSYNDRMSFPPPLINVNYTADIDEDKSTLYSNPPASASIKSQQYFQPIPIEHNHSGRQHKHNHSPLPNEIFISNENKATLVENTESQAESRNWYDSQNFDIHPRNSIDEASILRGSSNTYPSKPSKSFGSKIKKAFGKNDGTVSKTRSLLRETGRAEEIVPAHYQQIMNRSRSAERLNRKWETRHGKTHSASSDVLYNPHDSSKLGLTRSSGLSGSIRRLFTGKNKSRESMTSRSSFSDFVKAYS